MCKFVLTTTDQKIVEKSDNICKLEQRFKEIDNVRSLINGGI